MSVVARVRLTCGRFKHTREKVVGFTATPAKSTAMQPYDDAVAVFLLAPRNLFIFFMCVALMRLNCNRLLPVTIGAQYYKILAIES